MKRTIWTLIFLLILTAGSVIAADHQGKPYVGSKAFERIKTLVGAWEGQMDMGQGPMKITSSYKISAGGSAVVETTFGGTPMEMVTIYHDNSKGRLTMTHYCMLHNQPKMMLTSDEGDSLSMELAKGADIDMTEEHMHSLTIKFLEKDKISQRWSNFK